MTVKRTVEIGNTALKMETNPPAQMTPWSRATFLINEMAHLVRSQAFPRDRPPAVRGISLCRPPSFVAATSVLSKACALHHAGSQLFDLLLRRGTTPQRPVCTPPVSKVAPLTLAGAQVPLC